MDTLLLCNDAMSNICEIGFSLFKSRVNNGAEMNLLNDTYNGFSPLYGTCKNGHAGTAQLSLTNIAQANLRWKEGFSPLHTLFLYLSFIYI